MTVRRWWQCGGRWSGGLGPLLGRCHNRRRLLLHIAGPRPADSQQVTVMQVAIVRQPWEHRDRSSVYVRCICINCMHTINQYVSVPLVGAVHHQSGWSLELRRRAISWGLRREPPLQEPGICHWLNRGLMAVISGLGLGRLLPFSGVEPVNHRCNRRPLRLNIRAMGRPWSSESCTSTQVWLLTRRTPHTDDRGGHLSMHIPQLQQISPASGGPTSSLGYRKTRRCNWGRDNGCGNSQYSSATGIHQRDRYGSQPMQRPAGGSGRRGRRRCSDC